MALSDDIYDFARTLKSYSLDYNFSEIISYLEDFCEEASELEAKLDTAIDRINSLECDKKEFLKILEIVRSDVE